MGIGAKGTRTRCLHAVIAVLLTGLTAVPLSTPAIAQETVRIMPLGDSITENRNGDATYRYFLYQLLTAAGHSVDFVGSLNGVQGRGLPKYPDFDQDHEGHSGWRADRMANYARTFAQQASAQIVLVHLGTNDVLRGQSNASTKRDLLKVINELRLANSEMLILLAELIPIEGHEAQVEGLNTLIRALASETNTANSPVIAIDQYTGFSVNTDLHDGIHPTESGFDKMADGWFAALGPLLGGGSPPTSVAITDPDEGSSFSSGSPILIRASVTGGHPVSRVEFVADGVPIGEDLTSPYEFAWSDANVGQIALRADAYQEGGAVVSSSIVSITVDDIPESPDVLLVVGDPGAVGTSDALMIERLNLLGYNVIVADDTGIKATAAQGKALVMISASVSPGKVGSVFTAVLVPVINWQSRLFDDLGMTGPVLGLDYGETASTDNRTTILVNAPSHPLAAGLSGAVTVFDPPSRFMWGMPNSNAALVATLENDPAKFAVFGYETGTAMVSGSAPARRVGLFLYGSTGSTLTASGWAIVDAAVRWATEG